MTTRKRPTKAEARRQAQLDRQRARARRPDPDQSFRNQIGANLCRAILRGREAYRDKT